MDLPFILLEISPKKNFLFVFHEEQLAHKYESKILFDKFYAIQDCTIGAILLTIDVWDLPICSFVHLSRLCLFFPPSLNTSQYHQPQTVTTRSECELTDGMLLAAPCFATETDSSHRLRNRLPSPTHTHTSALTNTEIAPIHTYIYGLALFRWTQLWSRKQTTTKSATVFLWFCIAVSSHFTLLCSFCLCESLILKFSC